MPSPDKDVRYHAVISDLHFGDGLALEDFLYEEDFAAFLEHVHRRGVEHGGAAELVVNGDFIDFLQIAPLEPSPWRAALGKLERVAAAHPRSMIAFAKFLAAGNRVVVLPGNHDIELAFRDVQAALAAHLSGGDPAAAARVVFPNEAPLGPHFKGWTRGPFVHRLPGVYIEHGNQFDALNYFDHADFYASNEKEAVKLPWGSYFVLDLFNDVEARYRFIDKLRPRSAAILILWLLDPEMVRSKLGPLRSLGPRLFSELRRYQRTPGGPAGEGTRSANARSPGGPEGDFLALLAANADDLEIIDRQRALLDGEGLRGSRGVLSDKLSAAYASVFRSALSALTATPDDRGELDDYAHHAAELGRAEGAEIAIFGHTHGIKDVTAGGVRYLNTGTWIGLVDLDRKALEQQDTEAYKQLLTRLKDDSSFVPLKLLTFVEIAYPGGKLEASVRVFQDGEAKAPVRS